MLHHLPPSQVQLIRSASDQAYPEMELPWQPPQPPLPEERFAFLPSWFANLYAFRGLAGYFGATQPTAQVCSAGCSLRVLRCGWLAMPAWRPHGACPPACLSARLPACLPAGGLPFGLPARGGQGLEGIHLQRPLLVSGPAAASACRPACLCECLKAALLLALAWALP